MMSTISSTAGAGLSHFLQNLAGTGAAASESDKSGASSTNPLSTLLQQVGKHQKHHAGVFDKLANAITGALKSAADGSGGGIAKDANQTITDALSKIFKNGSLGSSADTDGDSESTSTSPDAASKSGTNAALPADFLQTLKSFGVTAQQFQADISAALKTAQESGKVDVGSVFKSFPVGSVVDSIG